MVAIQIQVAINNGSDFLVSRSPNTKEISVFTPDKDSKDALIVDANRNEIRFKGASWSDLTINDSRLKSYKNQACISKQEYLASCQHIIHAIKNDEAEKIILSRLKEVQLEKDKLGGLFDQLCSKYPTALIYLFHHKGISWLGATPELLASFKDSKVSCASLAGTISKEHSQWTQKEIDEQQIVTDFISRRVEQFGSIEKIDGPHDLIAGEVRHLQTMIHGSIQDPFAFLKALHPTPAIAGYPVKNALNIIANMEAHERRLYTGFIQFNNTDSSSAYVNLRCLEHHGDKAYLYLGGGITCDSDPENEWNETELKARTLLSVIEKL